MVCSGSGGGPAIASFGLVEKVCVWGVVQNGVRDPAQGLAQWLAEQALPRVFRLRARDSLVRKRDDVGRVDGVRLLAGVGLRHDGYSLWLASVVMSGQA